MLKKLTTIGALAAVGCMCLFSADVAKPQTQIVLLRTYVSTNQIPGYIGGPEPVIGTNGYYLNATLAIAITHPPRTEIVTNYVIGYWDGTNAVELLTASKR